MEVGVGGRQVEISGCTTTRIDVTSCSFIVFFSSAFRKFSRSRGEYAFKFVAMAPLAAAITTVDPSSAATRHNVLHPGGSVSTNDC